MREEERSCPGGPRPPRPFHAAGITRRTRRAKGSETAEDRILRRGFVRRRTGRVKINHSNFRLRHAAARRRRRGDSFSAAARTRFQQVAREHALRLGPTGDARGGGRRRDRPDWEMTQLVRAQRAKLDQPVRLRFRTEQRKRPSASTGAARKRSPGRFAIPARTSAAEATPTSTLNPRCPKTDNGAERSQR